VSDLEEVECDIAPLLESAPGRAVAPYEAFLAGCFEKVEELDDSSGAFGMFVEDLFCGWVKACQAAGAAREETASRLLGWMDDDPYGFCYGLETKVASVLNKAGLAALVAQVRERLATPDGPADGSEGHSTGYKQRRWAEVLRALHVGQKDVAAYVALAQQTGLSAKDCHAVAGMLIAKRKPEEALSWAERGIEITAKDPRGSSADYELQDLRRELLRKLGRDQEALASAWGEFREHPSKYTYNDVMKFAPKQDRASWHAKAMETAAGADLYSLIGLFVETKETARLSGQESPVTVFEGCAGSERRGCCGGLSGGAGWAAERQQVVHERGGVAGTAGQAKDCVVVERCDHVVEHLLWGRSVLAALTRASDHRFGLLDPLLPAGTGVDYADARVDERTEIDDSCGSLDVLGDDLRPPAQIIGDGAGVGQLSAVLGQSRDRHLGSK
jgi:hypothetical protein